MRGRFRRCALSAVLGAAALTAVPAVAQTVAPPITHPGVVVNPSWITRPRPMAPTASPAYLGGVVDLTCTSQPTGELTDCAVTFETPNEVGLGAVALASIGPARMSPRAVDGLAEASSVRFSIQFGRDPQPPVVRLPVPAPPPGEPILISPPRAWARPPVSEYPERAAAAGVDRGRVVVNCGFISNGDLVDCHVVEEEPADMSFGLFTLFGARRGQLSHDIVRDSPMGSRVQFTTRYISPGPVTSPAAPGTAPAPTSDSDAPRR